MDGTAVARMVESSAMSDVDSMRAMRIGPRSERNPRFDEVDTILLMLVEPAAGGAGCPAHATTKRDNARGRGSFPSRSASVTTHRPAPASRCCHCVLRPGSTAYVHWWPGKESHGANGRCGGGDATRRRAHRTATSGLRADALARPAPAARVGGRGGARSPRGGDAAAADRDAHRAGRRHGRTPCRGPEVALRGRLGGTWDRYELTARERLTCGCHVHVSVESDEEGVGVLDRIRVWLPSLLALSANSPFWNGQDSGYASYRSQAFARWPSWGPADRYGSAEAYHRLVRRMVLSSVILDPGMVYFDARLSQHYPTVEIRAADVCFTVEEAIVGAALCRGLVETAALEWAAGMPEPT